MSSPSTFERARQPAQKQQRRQTVLAAARRVFDERGVEGTTLSALAREVGLAKSNLYRYFESREAILLQLFLAELEEWSARVAMAMKPLRGSDDADRVVDALVTSMTGRPRLVRLSAAVPSVLEHNVSEATVIETRLGSQRWLASIIAELSSALPSLGAERAQRFFQHFSMHAVGAWPSAHPSEVVRCVERRPEFAAMSIDYAEMLGDHARVLLRGLAAEGAQ